LTRWRKWSKTTLSTFSKSRAVSWSLAHRMAVWDSMMINIGSKRGFRKLIWGQYIPSPSRTSRKKPNLNHHLLKVGSVMISWGIIRILHVMISLLLTTIRESLC
jgi:hypothetical protein